MEGHASREMIPNLATVTLGITADRPTAADASAQAGRIASGLVEKIKASGIGDRDIKTVQSSLTPLMEPTKPGSDVTKLKGFRATDLLEIRVRDLTATGALVERLVDKGANAIESIDFSVDNVEAVMDGLRGDATRDARRKAALYADAAGVRLGRIIEIVPEASGPAPFMQRAKADSILAAAPAAAPPMQAGTETLDARVRITWELAP